jgi:hypothetical protein
LQADAERLLGLEAVLPQLLQKAAALHRFALPGLRPLLPVQARARLLSSPALPGGAAVLVAKVRDIEI